VIAHNKGKRKADDVEEKNSINHTKKVKLSGVGEANKGLKKKSLFIHNCDLNRDLSK
jgi:hypothetical protein